MITTDSFIQLLNKNNDWLQLTSENINSQNVNPEYLLLTLALINDSQNLPGTKVLLKATNVRFKTINLTVENS